MRCDTLKLIYTTIQVRVDEKTKKVANRAFRGMGLDISSGVKLFLHQVVKSQTIPFPIRTANGFTVAEERQMIKETKEALRSGKSYRTAKEMFDDIMKN